MPSRTIVYRNLKDYYLEIIFLPFLPLSYFRKLLLQLSVEGQRSAEIVLTLYGVAFPMVGLLCRDLEMGLPDDFSYLTNQFRFNSNFIGTS